MLVDLTIRTATSEADIEIARTLLREYAAYLNQSLGEEHICLKGYEKELASLPGPYAEPQGVILLAWTADHPAGCVALKPLTPDRAIPEEESACEMKRLWVRPEFRGHGLGLELAEALIDSARQQGYTAMYLDTVPAAMQAAASMYRKLGFGSVERYNTNPLLGDDPTVAVEFLRMSLLPRTFNN